MIPYYSDNFVTIYNCDAMDVVEDIVFDVFLTDPPYGLDGATKKAEYNGTREITGGK